MTEYPRIYEEEGQWYYQDGVHNLRINLTLLFGKGKEPKSVDGFLNYFPSPYIRYPKYNRI